MQVDVEMRRVSLSLRQGTYGIVASATVDWTDKQSGKAQMGASFFPFQPPCDCECLAGEGHAAVTHATGYCMGPVANTCYLSAVHANRA